MEATGNPQGELIKIESSMNDDPRVEVLVLMCATKRRTDSSVGSADGGNLLGI